MQARDAPEEEIIHGQKLAVDEDGRVLVWTATSSQLSEQASSTPPSAPPPDTQEDSPSQMPPSPVEPHPRDAERRQLTIMFYRPGGNDGAGQPARPGRLARGGLAYQSACATVIARYEGHIAQYLSDGLLVYFGYPWAHEDDAQGAVRAALGIIEAMGQLNTRLDQDNGLQLAVRVGIDTGLVVVGALVEQGQGKEGLAQLHQGMAVALATGLELSRPLCLVLMAEAAGYAGQVAEGLRWLTDALTAKEASRRDDLLAEGYRLQGELLLRRGTPDTAQAEG